MIIPIKTLQDFSPRYEFFVGRAIDNKTHPKVRYPAGIPISQLFMGEDHLGKDYLSVTTQSLYLVEGPMDWLRMYGFEVPSLCCFSAQLTNTQTTRLLRLLRVHPYQKIVVAFDGDLAGWMGAVEAVRSLAPYVNVEMLRLPEGTDPCDFQNKNEFLALPRVSANEMKIPEFTS
jgi:DNA primase